MVLKCDKCGKLDEGKGDVNSYSVRMISEPLYGQGTWDQHEVWMGYIDLCDECKEKGAKLIASFFERR